MNLQYHFLVIIAILNNFCCANKFHLESCTVHHLNYREYGYKDFFEVSSLNKNWIKANERLHLKFYVMTTMEAHILLSEDSKWENGSSARGYEIVLGGVRNSLSWINVGNSTIRVPVKVNSPKILSAFEPIPVEIIQTNDGELIVNIPGYAEPLLKYWDVTSTPVNIKFFSFGTYKKQSAKWFYNCQSDGQSNIKSQTKSIGDIAERNQEHYSNRQTNLSGTGPTNRHVSFFLGLVPTLDNFKDDQVVDFQSEVLELVKKIKNPATTTTTTTTTENPRYKIDVRMGYTDEKLSP